MSRFPKPPGVTPPQPQQTINNEDVLFILKTELKKEHFENFQIIGFIAAYLNCRDVKQAASVSNVSFAQAREWRKMKDIATAIDKVTEAAVLKYNLDAGEIVERVKEISNLDPADLMKPDGTFIDNLKEIPPETRRAIKEFKAKNIYEEDANGMKVMVGKLIEVKFWDKLKGNELLGREKNLFTEKSVVTHDVTSNMMNILLQAKERSEQRALEARNHPSLKMIDVTPKGDSHGETVESVEAKEVIEKENEHVSQQSFPRPPGFPAS
jgi:hypothetical protein